MTKIDEINARILRELGRNARIGNAALAETVGLSASATLRRVQDMERQGIIGGYRAVLNPAAMGRGFVAYLAVGLSDHSKDSQRGFERAVAGFDEVVECHNVTGNFEYILRIETRDLDSYKRLHTDRLGALPNVRQMTTHVVMESPKDARA